MNITQRKYAIQRLDTMFNTKIKELYAAQLEAANAVLAQSQLTKVELMQYFIAGKANFIGAPDDTICDKAALDAVLDLDHVREFLGKPEHIKVNNHTYVTYCGSNWYFNSYNQYLELLKALQEAKDQLMLQDAQAALQALEQFGNIQMSTDYI